MGAEFKIKIDSNIPCRQMTILVRIDDETVRNTWGDLMVESNSSDLDG
jgi:hypothetical protein